MKVFCKKTFKSPESNQICFEEGKNYNIHYNYNDCYWIKYEFGSHRFMKGDKINQKIRHGLPVLFNEYFQNIQELRKLKIEKLNKVFFLLKVIIYL